MKMHDEGNKLGIAITSGFVETHAGDLHVYADRTQAGNIVFITTDNFKNYIPIEWLKKKCNEADDVGMGIEDWSIKDCFGLVLEQWEAENG